MVIRHGIHDGRVRAACILLAWYAMYARLVPGLVFDWTHSGDFSHGFLIPIVSVVLIVMRRSWLARAVSAPDARGAWLLLLGLAIQLAGSAASELYLQRFSMIPFLLGWILLLEGKERMRILLFPVLFLLFMIPPPNIFWSSISFPLQLLASRTAEGALQLAHVPVVRDGNVLHLESCSLEVLPHAVESARSWRFLHWLPSSPKEASSDRPDRARSSPRFCWSRRRSRSRLP